MNTAYLESLTASWRSDADTLRRRGAEQLAECMESMAAEFEAALREWMDEQLTLEEAAAERGLKYDTMRKRVERGVYVNVGKKGAPRVRRANIYKNGRITAVDDKLDIAEQILRACD